ncbi:MAG: hypothetical protein U0228_33250 [Myxococcaceae bacterium]
MKRAQADLAATTPQKCAAQCVADLKRNVSNLREQLKKLKAQGHPTVKQAFADVDAYEQQVTALVSASNQPAAPTVGVLDPNAPPLAGASGFKLDRVKSTHKEFSAALEQATPEDFAPEGSTRDGYFRGGARQMREQLKDIADQDHPQVKAMLALIVTYEGAVEAKIAKGLELRAANQAAAAAEKAEVGSELDDLATYFDQGKFNARLDPPFTEARVRAWIENLKQWDAAKAKGAATLDKLVADHPKYANDPKLKQLRWWFTDPNGLTRALKSGIGHTAETWSESSNSGAGEMPGRVAIVKGWMPAGAFADSRFGNELQLAADLKAIAEGVEAGAALVIYAREYKGAGEAEAQKTADELKAFQAKVEARGKALIAKNRFPPAESTDPNLLATARKLLPDCGAGKIERLLINYGPKRKTERMSSSRDEGQWIRITSWNEAWEEFQVVTAEPEGNDFRLVYYDFRYRSVGPSWTITNRWYCSGRMPSGRILKENINK